MVIRAATTDPFSLSDAAAVVAGLLVVGILVVCISICAEDSPISKFLRRTQTGADVSRFNELLDALDDPQRNSTSLSGVTFAASREEKAAANVGAALGRQPRTRDAIGASDRD